MAEALDPRTGLAEPVLKLLVELGEAEAHVMEVVGVGAGERVVKAVKLKEDVKCPVTLRRGEAVGIRV